MSRNYWELKPEDLNAEELQKYIGDWYYNQVNTIGAWGEISSNEALSSIRADVAQLAYALLLLEAKFPFED